MLYLLREEWSKKPEFKKWLTHTCTYNDTKCKCEDNNEHLVELWEQDSCTRGRIDTIVCTKCDAVVSFSIVR